MSIWRSAPLFRSAAVVALIGGAQLFGAASYAQARQTPAPQDDQSGGAVVEEVVVTGTLIRGVAPVGTNVVGVDSEAIAASGAASANDLLARVPQLTTSFNTAPSPGATIALPINRPNIRNLGASGGSTTLVLLNGMRIVGAGVLQTSPDPSVIPPSVLERVEVIPDGGSSIYGSDAIGGVVNFITRKRYDGVEVSARYGLAKKYHQSDVNVTAGKSWDGGSVLIAYSRAEHDNILGSQRDYIHADNRPWGGSDFRVTNCAPGTVTAGGVSYALPGRTVGANSCDENDFIDFYPREDRNSVFGALNQQFSDRLTLDVAGFYSSRETTRLGQSSTDGTGLRGSGAITSANPYFRAIAGETSQTVAFNYSPVFGMAEANPSRFTSAGLTPVLTYKVNDNWRLKASANWGRSSNTVHTYQIDTTAQANALAGTTTATALNPYDLTATNPAVLAAIRNFEIKGYSVQTIKEARAVADGELFDLGAGAVKLAAGAEFHQEEIDAAQGQGPRGNPVMFTSHSERKVTSLFGEVLAPVLGADSGVGALNLSASARYDHYDDVGSTTNPKIGFTYVPTPSFKIRGNWGTSFHAPSLADTGNAVDVRAQVLAVSPFRPASSAGSDLFRPTILLAGGNANLKPEKAHTWSIGFDWNPSAALQGLTVSGTYYNVDFTDAIGLAPFFSGASYFANPSYASFFTINPTLAQATAATAGQRVENAPSIASLYTGTSSPYLLIDARRNNLGTLKVDGVDFDIRYSRPVSFGTVRASLSGTYTLNRDSQAVAGAPKVDELKNGNAKLAMVGTLGADAGGFSALLTVNRGGGYPVVGVIGQTKVKAFTTANLFFRYRLPQQQGWLQSTELTLNVDNVFNQDPPYYNDSDGYANGSTLGRLVSVGVKKAF